jgi:hypothetical protein
MSPTDLAGKIMAYEAGEMTRTEVRELFQTLIDMEIVWKMHGSYGRMARILIERGECHSHQDAPLEFHQPEQAAQMQPWGRAKLGVIAALLLAVLAFVLLAD